MRLINEYSNLQEAYIDKGYLDANGVNAVVDADALSEIFPAPGSGNGSISLYVPDNQYEEAVKLLNSRSNR